jgi:PhzF family phenazine biosynthesis protein
VFIVDAFAELPYAGNPAGVVLLDEPRDDPWRQAVAAELRHSETAFVEPADAGAWTLRWFTPTVEVDLCGHATLASAHALWETGRLAEGEPARFGTRSGTLSAVRLPDGRIELDLPVDRVRPVERPAGLQRALGCEPVFVGSGATNLLVELASAADVRALAPDQAWLMSLPDGLIVTARSDVPGTAIVSRYFCPADGIPEDPVTGSAHCALAAHWAPRLGHSFRALQVSERGGVVDVVLRGDRVGVAGRAVTRLEGRLRG